MNRPTNQHRTRSCFRMRFRIIVLLWLGFVHTASAQQVSDFVLTRTIPGDLADFTVDNLGNIYVLSQDNQLKKLSPSGDSLAVFNDVRRYGKILSLIHISEPTRLGMISY